MNRPTVAVAIPTYGRDQVLCQSIEAILKQSIQPDEFVIIDQSESHLIETTVFLTGKVEQGQLRWIRQSPPSLTAARNRALKETDSDILIFIDDDILTHRDFLAAHLVNYANPVIDAVCGQVRTQNGNQTDKLLRGFDPSNGLNAIRNLPHNYSKWIIAPMIVGCNFSVRRAVMRQISGFNEYLQDWEDSDLGLRLFEKGCRIAFDPAAWIVHLQASSGGCRFPDKISFQRQWRRAAGIPYFAFRHCGLWNNGSFFLKVMWNALRNTVFFKSNLLNIRKWPQTYAALVKGMYQGYVWARLREPLVTIDWDAPQNEVSPAIDS